MYKRQNANTDIPEVQAVMEIPEAMGDMEAMVVSEALAVLEAMAHTAGRNSVRRETARQIYT